MKFGPGSGRRKIIWQRVKGFKAISAFSVATALGAGLFPIAPGTMGTLFAVPLAYASRDWAWTEKGLLWLGLTLLGTWAAKEFDEMMETHDNQNIVIDEVVGLGITAWTAGSDPKNWIAAFVLFRIFDMIKPPPVRQVDTWSKNQSSPWWGGFGVIADDIVAAIQALSIILLLQWLKILS